MGQGAVLGLTVCTFVPEREETLKWGPLSYGSIFGIDWAVGSSTPRALVQVFVVVLLFVEVFVLSSLWSFVIVIVLQIRTFLDWRFVDWLLLL